MELFTSTGNNYIIYYHIRPDGDCIGAAYGLAVYLRSMGNRVLVLGHDPVPPMFDYQLEDYRDDFSEDCIPEDVKRIVIDTASPDRIGKYQNEKIDILIDHHKFNSFEAPVKIVDEEAGACTEMLWDMMKEQLAGSPVRKKVCDLFYMGIITDSNCFRNESVRPNTIKAAYELAEAGADYCLIAQKHALIKSREQQAFEDRLTSSYTFYEGGIVAGILTQQDSREIGLPINTYEVLSSLPMNMEDTMISLVIRELEDGTSRVAVRSRGNYSADLICRRFGGGGHENAAGCTLDLSPLELRELFVKAAQEHIRQVKAAENG